MAHTTTLCLHLTTEEEFTPDELRDIASSIRHLIREDWTANGANLAGYDGTLVEECQVSLNGILLSLD